jgi:hypothetical protein
MSPLNQLLQRGSRATVLHILAPCHQNVVIDETPQSSCVLTNVRTPLRAAAYYRHMSVDDTSQVSAHGVTRSSRDATLVATIAQKAFYCSAQPVYNQQHWCCMSATNRVSRATAPCQRHAVHVMLILVLLLVVGRRSVVLTKKRSFLISWQK